VLYFWSREGRGRFLHDRIDPLAAGGVEDRMLLAGWYVAGFVRFETRETGIRSLISLLLGCAVPLKKHCSCCLTINAHLPASSVYH
jgi:hypothetical protein